MSEKRFSLLTVACLFLLCLGIFAGTPSRGGTLPAPLPLFPADNWWNLDISAAPVDAGSASFITYIGPKTLHPDFGGDAGGDNIYGFPYVVVDGSQPKKTVQFRYADESDGYDLATGKSYPFYPIPDEAATQPRWIEGGPPGNVNLTGEQDRHMLIVDRENRLLYELWNTFFDGAAWHAGSGAAFDMKTNNRRPDGWTSADAAGLAILPGLIRYDEVYESSEEIRHAFRATVRATNSYYVYPASHLAGSNSKALPLGARLRLKAGVDLSRFSAGSQKIFRTMKKYGLIIADNGSDMYISGTYDTRWNNDILNPDFRGLTADDFEVVQLGYQPTAEVYFPHLAIGGGYATLVSLTNTGSTSASGSLSMAGTAGNPLQVSSTQEHSSFAGTSLPINIAPGAASFFTLTAPDNLFKVGWGRLQMSGGMITGVATFQYSPGGLLQTIAGVYASSPVTTATIPVDNDSVQERFAGYAVANPSAVDINLQLATFDVDGTPQSQVRPPLLNPLPANGQVARFLHQDLASALNFRGSMRITADGGNPFVIVALMQAHGLFTAVPVITAK